MIFIINIRLGDLTMLHHIKKLFGIKPKEAPAPIKYEDQIQSKISISFPEAPYKVETPVTPVADDVTRAMLESIPAPTLAEKPAKVKKAPAAKKARAPKKPKAE
jgi:hypothetical protein